MFERYITVLQTDDARTEDVAATRERLKEKFPRGATRRMTQLGMLLGGVLQPIEITEEDALVYATEFAETRALEGYLESFPAASPTLFQTSIHPSGVQQLLIGKQQRVREFFPMTGRAHLVAQALQTALLCPSPRAILCGGEECASWLLHGCAASPRAFAFALGLSRHTDGALARLTLGLGPATSGGGELSLSEFFDALQQRRALALAPAPGMWLTLSWS